MRETCYWQSLQQSYQKTFVNGKIYRTCCSGNRSDQHICGHFIKNSTRLSITSSNHHSNWFAFQEGIQNRNFRNETQHDKTDRNKKKGGKRTTKERKVILLLKEQIKQLVKHVAQVTAQIDMIVDVSSRRLSKRI